MRLIRSKGRPQRLRLPLLAAVAFGVFAPTARTPALEQPLTGIPAPAFQRDLEAVLSKLPHPQTRCSGCVIDLAANRVVYERYADAPLIPASAMKVFTMAAALAELGPDFTFETVLATDRVSLFVIGDGDPGFGDEKLHKARGEAIAAPFERWAGALRRLGLAVIPGGLVIDESIFDDQRLHPSWEAEDLGKWYAAPVGALNLNDNCLDITVSPAQQRNALALVTVQPESSMVRIVNNCRSGGEGTPVLHHQPGTLEYRISGRCGKRWPFSPVAFPDPGMLFADSLRTLFARHGVAIRGEIQRGRVRRPDGTLPPELTVVARHHTPMVDVLARAGKDSQNLFAECLLKRTGYAWAKRRGLDDPRGSWTLGAQAVVTVLERAGVSTGGFAVADGSGLSRDNACSARQLASTLAWAHRQPFGGMLHASLATAGADGSLRKRLKDSDGRVHAKTGTMRGVRTLAGYVDSDGGPRFAFAVMFNGYSGPSAPYKDVQDRFCRVLTAACGD